VKEKSKYVENRLRAGMHYKGLVVRGGGKGRKGPASMNS